MIGDFSNREEEKVFERPPKGMEQGIEVNERIFEW